MKYLLLIYVNETTLTAMGQAESRAIWQEAASFLTELEAEKGCLGALLETTSEALTVRRRGGDLLTAEGTSAQALEQLRGFILIDAEHLNAAVAVAATMSLARYGSVEVRPVRDLIQ